MAAGARLDETEMRAWRALLQASTLLVERLDRELQADHGLSLSEYEVLVLLQQAPRHRRRMSELAGDALLTRSRLTHTVDRLERAGLVRREACETDRRGSFAVLTRDGYRMLARASRTHLAGVRRRFLEPLAPGQVAVLADALGRVAAELRTEVSPGSATTS